MTTASEGVSAQRPEDPPDFSLVLGGPLFQLMCRAHIAGSHLELLRRRVLTFALAAWVPLLLLAALAGRAVGGDVAVPFLADVDVHVRFLLALPLLVVAELAVHQRMQAVVLQFRERNLIPAGSVGRFDAAIDSAMRLRNSVTAELLLVAFVYLIGIPLVWRQYAALTAATWYATPVAGGSQLTLAGWWYGAVSLPVFQFLLLRWYFRILIWMRFLWQVSRMPLALLPSHPDRVGGVGFLANTAHAFIPLAAAHGALLAGWIGNRILHLQAALLDFKVEIGVVLALMLLAVFGPLLVFAPQLARAKRNGLRDYGILASRYARAFDLKWLHGAPAAGELLGSADLQSLADLGNCVEIVRSMRVVPMSRDSLVQLALATLAPLLPLLLTMMSLEELVKRLSGIVF